MSVVLVLTKYAVQKVCNQEWHTRVWDCEAQNRVCLVPPLKCCRKSDLCWKLFIKTKCHLKNSIYPGYVCGQPVDKWSSSAVQGHPQHSFTVQSSQQYVIGHLIKSIRELIQTPIIRRN